MSKNLRAEMTEIAAFLDSLREAFGKDMIDEQIRKGLRGEPTFWATENGHTIGTRNISANHCCRWDDKGISYWATPEWIIDARALAKRRGIEIPEADPSDLDAARREAEQLRAMVNEIKRRRADVCTGKDQA